MASSCIPHLWVVREPVPDYKTSTRTLKVTATHYDYSLKDQRIPRPVPWIQLKGYWLEQAGFTIGTPLTVKVSKGKLVITVAEHG